ncbi:MAG: hypothetical protein FJ245_07845 [Nitrospira sp.]|nr:hypothetical protein [Nitrospira sp.]
MDSARIGPIELVVLVVLAVGMGVAVTSGQSTMMVAAVAGTAFMIAAFLSTRLCLYFLVYSMLLGPELEFGGEFTGGATGRKGQASLGHGMTLRLDDFLLVIVGLIWLIKAAIHKQEAPLKHTPLNGPIMLYVAACAFATLMGVFSGRVKPLPGFFFNLKYFEYFFLYFMVLNVVETKDQVKGLITASLWTCLFVSLFALAQIPSGDRVSAPFEGKEGEPNTLGGYLVFMLSIVAGLLMTPGAVQKKWPLLALVFFGGFSVLATLSRSSYLAAAVVLVAIVGKMSYKRPLLFSIMFMVLAASPWWLPKPVTERVFFTFTQAAEKGQEKVAGIRVDTSTSERIRNWEQAMDSFKKSPIYGMGVTGARYFIDGMYPRTLSETGLFGLASFLWLCWMVFRVGWTSYHEVRDPYFEGIALGFLLGHLGILTHAIGGNSFIIVRIMEPYWLFAALVMKSYMLSQSAPEEGVEARGTPSVELSEAKPGLAWSPGIRRA